MVTAAEAVGELVRDDALMVSIRRRSNEHRAEHGPECDVFPSGPQTVQFLRALAGSAHGGRALDVGCGLGLSAIALARGLGTGRVDTVERSPTHAALARGNFGLAHLSRQIRIVAGLAEEVLPALRGRYDVVLDDAVAFRTPAYYDDLVRLARPGGFIVWENWFPLDPARTDMSETDIRGTLRWARRAFRDRRLRTTLIYPGTGLSVRNP